MTPVEILDSLTAWVMAAPERGYFVLGGMAGAFMMFSILTGYWIVSGSVQRMIQKLRGKG